MTYTYDGDGNRIEKSSGKVYWYGAGTEILDESDTSGNFTNEYVFFGGKRVAMRNVASGNIYYYEEDMLGSARTKRGLPGRRLVEPGGSVQAGQTSVCYDGDFYPFGGERVITNTCSQNYKFEGKERDTETGNDDFGARYYTSRLGRWLSADWSAVPAPVPYANLTNPQTLNLYAMVSDNPETSADLDGHTCYMNITGSAEITCSNILQLAHMGDGNQAPNTGDAQPPSDSEDAQLQADQQNAARVGIGIEVPAQSAVENGALNVAADSGHAFAYLRGTSGAIMAILSFGPGQQIGLSNKGEFTTGLFRGMLIGLSEAKPTRGNSILRRNNWRRVKKR